MATRGISREKNKERRKNRIPGILLSVVLLAVISLAAAVMITNNGRLDLAGLERLIAGMGGKTEATVFSYDAGVGAVYADLDGGLAVCSATGLQVFDRNADLTYSEAFEMSSPTICTGGSTACVYDLGGTAVRVFSQTGILYSLTAGSRIVSASLNDSGWLALCTESSGVYKGTVTVYYPSGNVKYTFNSATSGYVLSAAVSPDDKKLAVLTLNEAGSRIVFYELDSDVEKASCQLADSLVLDIRFLNTGSVLAVADDALILVHSDGGSQRLLDYTDKYLANFTTESVGFTALVLNNYMVGDQGGIVTVDKNGNTIGTLETTRKVLWLSASGDNLAVLYSDGLVVYDRYLKELDRYSDTAGAVQAIMRSDGTALLVLAHSAAVCVQDDE